MSKRFVRQKTLSSKFSNKNVQKENQKILISFYYNIFLYKLMLSVLWKILKFWKICFRAFYLKTAEFLYLFYESMLSAHGPLNEPYFDLEKFRNLKIPYKGTWALMRGNRVLHLALGHSICFKKRNAMTTMLTILILWNIILCIKTTRPILFLK